MGWGLLTFYTNQLLRGGGNDKNLIKRWIKFDTTMTFSPNNWDSRKSPGNWWFCIYGSATIVSGILESV